MNSWRSGFKASSGYEILSTELAAFRELTHDELAKFVGEPMLRHVVAADATPYAVEIRVRWRNVEGGDIVVRGWAAVDDCGPMRRVDDCFVVPRP